MADVRTVAVRELVVGRGQLAAGSARCVAASLSQKNQLRLQSIDKID